MGGVHAVAANVAQQEIGHGAPRVGAVKVEVPEIDEIGPAKRRLVVIEAADRSGSLITARMAADQGREVFVVPGSPMDPRYAGSNSLIRNGAILTRDASDILTTLGRPVESIKKSIQPTVEQCKTLNVTDHAKVLSELSSVATAVDEVVRRCQVSAAAVADVLLSLELEGRLERHRGNRVSLI